MKKNLKRFLLISLGIGFAGFGITGATLAYTNPELLEVISLIAEKGLEGLKEYFDFLIQLAQLAIDALV